MKEIFTQVLQMSLTGSIIALVVMALRLLLRKTPKRLVCLLWALVALRILCPISIESNFSLIPKSIADGQVVSSLTVYSEPALSVQSVPDGYAESIPIEDEFLYHVYQTPSAVPAGHDLMNILAWIWAAGAGVMILYAAISYLHLRYRMAEATRLGSNIWQSEYTDSPFVLGLLRPQIYLPYHIQSEDMPHVIAHEKAHIRRGDHWWKLLAYFILSLHWFNPVLWLSYILLCRDIESACDEAVIATMEKTARQSYSTALLHCSIRRHHIAVCPLAFGEVGVKERVKSVMSYKKPTFWIIVTVLAVCVVVAVCFLADPNPSREFSMKGNNVSDLNPEAIVERIMDIEDIDNSNVYMNSMNFSLQVGSDFNWADSQTVSYFFWKNQKTNSAQLRIFPDEDKYFITEPREWQEQEEIFLLRHYLEAVKYLPQYEIQQMAPADQYIIQHVAEGRPSDYERVITYSSDGVQETDGWFIHLRIQPLHANGDAYSGTADDVIELFYGDSNGKFSDYAKMWFDFTASQEQMKWTEEMKCTITEFPGITFKCTPFEIVAASSWEDSNLVENTMLIFGMPIWNAYFCDLTGDGLPEICSEVSMGSGIIDNRVIVFDYANGVSYKLENRGTYDYYLRMNDADGYLYVDKLIYNRDEVVSSGRLVFKDGCLQIQGADTEPVMVLTAKLLEIYDGYYIVEPVDGSCELSSADRIEVTMKNMNPSTEPQVGDILEIEYDGMIQETDPARISNPYNITVVKEASQENDLPNANTVFETDFAGNISLEQEMEMTEDEPYWRITINNLGEGAILMRIEGDILLYRVEPGTEEIFYAKDPWFTGMVPISFFTEDSIPMQGNVICERASVPLPGT